MRKQTANPVRRATTTTAVIWALILLFAGAVSLQAKDKKKKDAPPPAKPNILEMLDYSKIVWPNPPAITRIKFLSQFYGEKREVKKEQKKSGWMDRLAGVTTGETAATNKLYFQLVRPYGVGVDTKGRIYTVDEKVLAVFIYDPQSQGVELIKNGVQARFKLPTGLALDDADQLFVSDSVLKHVLVFDKDHKAVASISQGMSSPAGLAVDNENRFLYVCDTDLDQVLVYNADPPYNLLRSIGTRSGKHDLTTAGDFSMPTNVAVDSEGNVYVSDTFNDRVEIFDADGDFIREFGKAGDGPGYFARPKGIAVDGDGHVWVADAVQDRVQVFTAEGRLLIWMGGHGLLPGQFNTLAGLVIDNKNRVITSEQYPGRLQIFEYINDAAAEAERARRMAQDTKKSGETKSSKPAESAPAEAGAKAPGRAAQ